MRYPQEGYKFKTSNPTLLFSQKIAAIFRNVHGVYFAYVVPTNNTWMLSMDLQPNKNCAFMNLMVKSANLLTTIPFNHPPPPPERRRTFRTTVIKAIPLNVFDPPETEFSVVANWYLGFFVAVGGDMGGWSWRCSWSKF